MTNWLMSVINSKYLKLNTAQETWNAQKKHADHNVKKIKNLIEIFPNLTAILTMYMT